MLGTAPGSGSGIQPPVALAISVTSFGVVSLVVFGVHILNAHAKNRGTEIAARDAEMAAQEPG